MYQEKHVIVKQNNGEEEEENIRNFQGCIVYTLFKIKEFIRMYILNNTLLTKRRLLCGFVSSCIVLFLYNFASISNIEKLSNALPTSKWQISENNTCLKMFFRPGIEEIPSNIKILSSLLSCSTLNRKFSYIFEVDVLYSSPKFGKEFSKKVMKWLGNSNMLMKLAKNQTIIMIHDLLRQRTTVFNSLRSKKPSSVNSNVSLTSYLESVIDKSKESCDFCSPFRMTAEDSFGRIKGNHSFTAANAFKLSKWHSLFIPFEHSWFNIDMDIFLDLFSTSLKWFKKVNFLDRNAKFPVFIMDMFPRSGASQVHVHAQGIAGVGHYPGQFNDLVRIAESYRRTQNANYWETIVAIHETLGLSFTFKNVTVISPLVPQREHELWLLSDEPSTEFFKMMFYITQMYRDKFEKFCFSMSGALPILGERTERSSESPLSVVFIGTRGDCSSKTSDVSSLELYTFNNVNTDPYITIGTLQNNLDSYVKKYKSDVIMENLWT